MMLRHLLMFSMMVAAGTAQAAAIKIGQANRAFSMEMVTINKGDSVTFVNDDNVPHNVYSDDGGTKVDLGLQHPGATTELKLSTAGPHIVRCAIHPKMKLTVVVK